MTDTNLPTLYRNIMDGLPSDFARDVFLWASDKYPSDRHAYKAESFARKAAEVLPTIIAVTRRANWVNACNGHLAMSLEQEADLEQFMAQRFANLMIGGNIKTDIPLTRYMIADAIEQEAAA